MRRPQDHAWFLRFASYYRLNNDHQPIVSADYTPAIPPKARQQEQQNSHVRSTPEGPQKRSHLRSKSLQKNLGRRLARHRRARTTTPRSAARPSKCTAKPSASKHREAQRYQTPSPRKKAQPNIHTAKAQRNRAKTPRKRTIPKHSHRENAAKPLLPACFIN